MPNALMEAMALGLPCVSTDCGGGGAKFLIQNGENGILVPPNDENALTEAMIKVIADKEFAKKIGANALLVRTGALYHDLGKMVNPMYYTENQIGVNPLSALPYDEAAQIIISHVQEGVKIAEKWNLPYQIIEFISMHHGCSKVKYFYNSFKNEFPDREIDERKFTYPGPLPATKETAILMMSDAVEAASRSLKSYDEESISKLVEGVVNGQIADGQFKDAPISFRDVEVAKSIFKVKLQNIYHTRIQYPELKNQDGKDDKTALGEINKTLKKVRSPYRFQKK
jgi:putative nucleotidyltransferase with HDIG domain